jgi:hypothetical protein
MQLHFERCDYWYNAETPLGRWYVFFLNAEHRNNYRNADFKGVDMNAKVIAFLSSNGRRRHIATFNCLAAGRRHAQEVENNASAFGV